MTKETLGYVKLEWTCPSCGSKNPGPQQTCAECGAPQPEDVQFEQAAQEKLITDEEELARAKAGPDVHCAYCGTRNPAGTETCSQCGANLGEGEARESGRVVGAHRDRPARQVKCPSCGAQNAATALECSQCGASMATRRRERVLRRSAATQSRGCSPTIGIVIGVLVLLTVLFIILTSRTKDVIGRVESVSWTRSIAIEQLGPASHEDWRDEIPSDGELLSCSQKVHHTQDEPAPNANQVCGTPYTVDEGSGFGKVVQDCQYQVYEDWCAYTVEEWQPFDVITLEGNDFSPRWPVPQLGANQREGDREETFKCVFNADGKTHTYRTRDAQGLALCEIGSRWTLKVNTFGAVTDIERTD